jgi:N utilization substance protein A
VGHKPTFLLTQWRVAADSQIREIPMNGELTAALDYLEKERGIDRETLLKAMEEAIVAAATKSGVGGRNLRVQIDRKTGDIKAWSRQIVVEMVRDRYNEISQSRARLYKSDAQLGEEIEVEINPSGLGRIAAQAVKQLMMQRIRQYERDNLFVEYKDRVNDIVSGTVRRFERGDVVVDLGKCEAVMPNKERVPTEEYNVGDRLRALLLNVENEQGGLSMILSRAHPDFVKRLFALEVSEIADGTVEIKAIAREPGFRTKLAVHSADEKVDPVGACVGMRGGRVKNIVRELNGEKVDIIRWSPDIRTFVANALQPAKLKSLEIDEATHRVTIIVEPEQLSLAIGKRGQNARLTSKLTGWKVDIEADATATMGFEDQMAHAIQALAAVPGIDAATAEVLVKHGFATIEGILEASSADIAEIPEIGEQKASAIMAAVQAHAAKAAPAPAQSAQPTAPDHPPATEPQVQAQTQ